MSNKILALTKDKLLVVLGFIGNHGDPIPIDYIQQLYDKYADEYSLDPDTGKLILEKEQNYWKHGWKDENGSFTSDFHHSVIQEELKEDHERYLKRKNKV